MGFKGKQTYQEKELEILREAIDKAQKESGRRIIQSPEVSKIINIIEEFLRKKKLLCYGGTAINNILPVQDQFYDRSIEMPDYDFYSPNAMNDAKELADIYYKAGYDEVEAKAGQHYGTYKVFVNFIPIADITQMEKQLYNNLHKNAEIRAGLYYTPPDFLRMSMYLELSRPAGDVGRWEKVLKRLILLTKHHPLKGKSCDEQDFQRSFEDIDNADPYDVYNIIKQSFIDQGVIFFGGFATSVYSHYMPKKTRDKLSKTPDFDVLSEDPRTTATMIKERLFNQGIKNVKIVQRDGVGEVIAPHYEIKVGRDTVAFIYEPLACHSYNKIRLHNQTVKIATIDTMLSFYLAFLYANRPYYDKNRILCMAHYLYKVQARNRLQQKGVLKRFSIECYGKQDTQEDMRAEKANKYNELKNKRNSKEFEAWFLRYVPQDSNKKGAKRNTTRKPQKKRKQTKRRKRKMKIKPIFDF
jgi:hypothetical protein